MIGKVVKPRRDGKSSFYSAIRYIAGVSADTTDKCTYIGSRNLVLADFPGKERPEDFVALAASEMQSTATQNNRIKEPIFHAIVSWPHDEKPTAKQIEAAVNVITGNLNLEECQCVFAKHENTEHTHLHIAYSRVHPETYRAVQPAQRWTKKALEKSMREIELAQNWGRELNGKHYTIVDEQVVPVQKIKEHSITESLTQESRDFEAHTGEQSTQSKIQDLIPKEFLNDIESWEKLHDELEKRNIVYEKKGSGAIFKLEGQEIKASNIAKKYGLSHLEKRLGEYIPHQKENQNENLKQIETKNREEKEKQDEIKKEKKPWAILREKQRKEREELKKIQQETRKEKLQGSWKGKGAELNYIRSVLAVSFSKERKELMQKHSEEQEELRKSLNKTQKKKPERGNFIDSTNKAKTLNAADVGIFGLEAIRVAGGAGYRKKGENIPLVVDTGRKIRTTVVNEQAVLATLQLASAKWGGCQVNGTKEYKTMCVELAVKHNIKITNSELQQTIKETRHKQEEKKQERKQIKQRGNIKR